MLESSERQGRGAGRTRVTALQSCAVMEGLDRMGIDQGYGKGGMEGVEGWTGQRLNLGCCAYHKKQKLFTQ